ncbi:hypothetical protein OF83DRAFT_1054351, partial [Amylostereum chailletii]
ACSLQNCLSSNTYNPEKCEDHMRKLYACCQSLYDDTGNKGQSSACPMPSAVRHWIKVHSSS